MCFLYKNITHPYTHYACICLYLHMYTLIHTCTRFTCLYVYLSHMYANVCVLMIIVYTIYTIYYIV